MDKEKKNTYDRNLYAWRKANHICVRCGRRKAEGRYTACLMCRSYNSEHCRKYREKHKEYVYCRNNKNRKARYNAKKAAGICVRCGKRKAESGRVHCTYCLARNRRQRENARREKGIISHQMAFELGYCYWCCKRKAMPGKKICKECHDKSVITMQKARKKKKQMPDQYFRLAANNFWREKQAKKKPV